MKKIIKEKIKKLVKEQVAKPLKGPRPTTTAHVFEGCRCGPAGENINTGPSNNMSDSIVVQATGNFWSNTYQGEEVDPFLNTMGTNLFSWSYANYMEEQGLDWDYDPELQVNSSIWQLDNPNSGLLYDMSQNDINSVLTSNNLIDSMWNIEGSQAVKLLTCGTISNTCKPSCVTKVGTVNIPTNATLDLIGTFDPVFSSANVGNQELEINPGGHEVRMYAYMGSLMPKFESPYDNCAACCDEDPQGEEDTNQEGYNCRPGHISGTSKCVPCEETQTWSWPSQSWMTGDDGEGTSEGCQFESEAECLNSGCEQQQNEPTPRQDDLTPKKIDTSPAIDLQKTKSEPVDIPTDTTQMLQRRAGINTPKL